MSHFRDRWPSREFSRSSEPALHSTSASAPIGVSMNVPEHTTQQIGLGALEVLGQELGRVTTVVCGHRLVLRQRTLVGLLKDHAIAASHHDATLKNAASSYTMSVDSTRRCEELVSLRQTRADAPAQLGRSPYNEV